MSADNSVHLTGNVTRDPELRFSASGTAICNLGLAVNKRVLNKQTQQWEDGQVTFVDIVAFAGLAEQVAEAVSKGDRVTVIGELSYRSWETDDGQKRSKLEVRADEVSASLRFGSVTIAARDRQPVSASVSSGAQSGPPEYGEEDF